jgi:DNA repair photolyase
METLKIIYEPKGAAREYSPLAVNLRVGCEHGCLYCYGPLAFRKKRDSFHSNPRDRQHALEMLEHDAGILRGDDREILLSFATDPYSPGEMKTGLTRQALEILIANGLRFTVLTKGGSRAIRDFDLLEKYENCSFGTTLVFASQDDADHWEPNAASIADRIETIKTAHQKGIRTWVSMEPVIDPAQAIALVKALSPFVDHWKVGKLNYNKEISGKVDWPRFKADITSIMDDLGADYYLKNSLKDL